MVVTRLPSTSSADVARYAGESGSNLSRMWVPEISSIFTPYVPHQERNLSDGETVDFVVVRSDDEQIVVKLDATPVEVPEPVF